MFALKELKNTRIFSKVQKLAVLGRIKLEDSTAIITRYRRFSSTLQKKTDLLLDKWAIARKELEPIITNARRKGNLGIALTQIDGVPAELKAFSQISNITDTGADLGYVLQKSDRIFQTQLVNGFDRAVDTEAKLLEKIASKLGSNTTARGAIQLFTERAPCASCQSVINQFRERFPNIDLQVIDSSLYSH